MKNKQDTLAQINQRIFGDKSESPSFVIYNLVHLYCLQISFCFFIIIASHRYFNHLSMVPNCPEDLPHLYFAAFKFSSQIVFFLR